jgi:holo-[acyl-carrier protein] synthase
MILGLGSDLVDIRRIDATLRRFGDRFTARIFTAGERRRCDRRAARAEGYARRFAAKEACAKALGTGFRQGVFWRDRAARRAISRFWCPRDGRRRSMSR